MFDKVLYSFCVQGVVHKVVSFCTMWRHWSSALNFVRMSSLLSRMHNISGTSSWTVHPHHSNTGNLLAPFSSFMLFPPRVRPP